MYHTWIHPFPFTHIMDMMITNQAKVYQCSIKNKPKSTKINQMGPMGKYNIYTVRPNGMGDPRIPPVTSTFFCQATSRLGWRIVGLAQWLDAKIFVVKLIFVGKTHPCIGGFLKMSRWWQLRYLFF